VTSSRLPPTSRAFMALLPDLRRTARRLSRSYDDADDLVQETLLKVWSRLAMTQTGHSDATPIDDLRAYAFATLRNSARSRPAPPPGDGKTDACNTASRDSPAETHIAASEVMRALTGLPDDQQSLLRMRAIDGMSYAEIVAATGLPIGTVTSRLSRGRKALRAALGLPSDAPLHGMLDHADAP